MSEDWPLRPCVDSFLRVGKESVSELIAWMRSSDLDDPHLSLAAEVLGVELGYGDGVVHYLLELLDHKSPYVREGAVLGLAPKLAIQHVRDALGARRDREESPGVRSAIEDVLDD